MHDLPGGLVVAEHGAIPASGVNVVWIRGIGNDVAKLECPGRRPIAIGDFAVIAAAGNCSGAAVLLRGVNVIGKVLVGAYVIKLTGRLVVPGTPGLAAVHADDRALIDAQDHVLRVRRIDPENVKIVSARRTQPGFEGAASVGGAVHGGLRYVDSVCVPG